MLKIKYLACVLLLSACSTKAPSYLKYSPELSLSPAAAYVLAHRNLDTSKPITSDAAAIFSAMSPENPPGSLPVRRAVISALIAVSDAQCESYMVDFIKAANTTKAGLGVGGLFLSGAAGLTSPVENANLLSGISTFLAGTSTELSQTVLGGKTPDILYRAVMAARASEREKLITLLNKPELGVLAPDVAFAQLQAYHGMCGPISGLNALSAAVETAQRVAASEGQDEAARTTTEILKDRKIDPVPTTSGTR